MNITHTSQQSPPPPLTCAVPTPQAVISVELPLDEIPPSPGIIHRIKDIFCNAMDSIQSSAIAVVETITSLANRVKDFALSFVPEMHFEITTTKIEQIILTGFAIYAGLGAKILADGIFPTTFLQWSAAAPFYGIATASLWHATGLVDYDRPEIINKIRQKAHKLPLIDVVNQHGWRNLFLHQILSPTAFQKAFRNLANILPFKELCAFARDAKSELAIASSSSIGCVYQIPPLVEWVASFHHDTQDLELSEILGKYPLSDLQALEVLPPDEFQFFEKAQSFLNEFNQEKEIIRTKLNDYIRQADNMVSRMDPSVETNNLLNEEFQSLGDSLNKVRHETIEQHQKRLSEIGAELITLTESYNRFRSSRPNKA